MYVAVYTWYNPYGGHNNIIAISIGFNINDDFISRG